MPTALPPADRVGRWFERRTPRTEVDAQGQILDVRVRRPPAAPEVGPWVLSMIRKAGPFPPPAKLGKATYTEVWLVHKSGNFQLDTLTEGQN